MDAERLAEEERLAEREARRKEIESSLSPAERRAREAKRAKRKASVEKARAARRKTEKELDRQLARLRKKQATAQKRRVKYLLGLSDIFRHFMDGDEAPPGSSPSSPPSSSSSSAAAAAAKAGQPSAISSPPGSPARGGASGEPRGLQSPSRRLQRSQSMDETQRQAQEEEERHLAGEDEDEAGEEMGASGASDGDEDEDEEGSDEDEDEDEDEAVASISKSKSKSKGKSPRRASTSAAVVAPTTRLTRQPSVIEFGTMRDYQIEGLNWMIGLQDTGLNGILADEMGLGKTLQTISLLGYNLEYRKVRGPHLVLVPKSTLANWCNEFKRWCPSLRALRFHGTKEERQEIMDTRLLPGQPEEDRDWDVCVTTYEMAIIEKGCLGRFPWQYLVIDEAHRLKNESSTLARVVRNFAVAHRLLLTGTPLQNNLHELWALLNFLLPDVFGDSDAFDSWFDVNSGDEDAKKNMITQLHRILRPFMLRRVKKEVAKSLPPKKETFLYVGLSETQRGVYRNVLKRDLGAIRSVGGDAEMAATGDKTRLLNIVMQLRKCCNHPYLFEGVEDRTLPALGEHLVESSAKLQLLDKLLPRLRQDGHRVLIFSQMTRMMDILEDYCVMRGYQYCRLDGQSSYEHREQAIDAYNAPGSDKFIFMLSTRAGGLGINLATADTVILFDSDWNPQVDLQAQDRAHRIGQTKPVIVYRLITADTIEERVVERAMVKLKLDAVVVQQGRLADKQKAMSKEEMLSMIRFGADAVFRQTGKQTALSGSDLDAILARGEERTREITGKLEEAAKEAAGGEESMLDFKLDFSGAQVFEGVDYSNAKQRDGADMEKLNELASEEQAKMLAPARRERRVIASYNEKTLLTGTYANSRAKTGGTRFRMPRGYRMPRIEPWHLVPIPDAQRVHEISMMEARHILDEQRRKKEHKAGKATGSAPMEDGDDGDKADADGPSAASGEFEPRPFDPELLAERESILRRGFTSWRKRDFKDFVDACKSFGRAAIDQIADDISGKTNDQVRTYHQAFFSTGSACFEPGSWTKMMAGIERGEAHLRDNRRLGHSAVLKVAYDVRTRLEEETELKQEARGGGASSSSSSSAAMDGTPPRSSQSSAIVRAALDGKAPELPETLDLWRDMSWRGNAGIASKGFSTDADRVIALTAIQTGLGRYRQMRAGIASSERLRFDYYARSRQSDELEQRAELVLRAMERDVAEEIRLGEQERLKAVKEVERKEKSQRQRREKAVKDLEKRRATDGAKLSELQSKIKKIKSQMGKLRAVVQPSGGAAKPKSKGASGSSASAGAAASSGAAAAPAKLSLSSSSSSKPAAAGSKRSRSVYEVQDEDPILLIDNDGEAVLGERAKALGSKPPAAKRARKVSKPAQLPVLLGGKLAVVLRRAGSLSIKKVVNEFMPMCEKGMAAPDVPTKAAVTALVESIAFKAPLAGSGKKMPVWQLNERGHKLLHQAIEEQKKRKAGAEAAAGEAGSNPSSPMQSGASSSAGAGAGAGAGASASGASKPSSSSPSGSPGQLPITTIVMGGGSPASGAGGSGGSPSLYKPKPAGGGYSSLMAIAQAANKQGK